MKLEEEIKQKKFKNEYHKLAVNLIFTSNWLNALQEQFFKRYNLTPEQFNILRILRGQNGAPVTINLIQDRMLNKMSNVSRLVDKLLLKKLVNRKTSSMDRRSCEVRITGVGLDLLRKIDSVSAELDMHVQGISRKEAGKCNELLDKIRINNQIL